MARPPTIRDEQILEAAREVFLARGMRATTAEVAERAGISEGSIFNRFKSKVDLFRAALNARLDAEPTWVARLERVGASDMQAELVDLGLEIVESFRAITPLLMMSWSNPPPEGLPCHLTQPDPPPLRGLRALAGYFDREMRSGRLRRVDPDIVARTFLGGIQTYVFFELLLQIHDQHPLPAETFVRGHVNLLWSGIAPSA